jgi:hypothetical protein
LFDMMDEIVPVHFARWRKLRTLGHHEKRNGMSEKLASLKIFCRRPGTRRSRRRQHVLMQEPGVAEFRKPALVRTRLNQLCLYHNGISKRGNSRKSRIYQNMTGFSINFLRSLFGRELFLKVTVRMV